MINLNLFTACLAMSWMFWWAIYQPSTRRTRAAVFVGVVASSLIAALAAGSNEGAAIIFTAYAAPHLTTALYALAQKGDVDDVAKQLQAGEEEVRAKQRVPA